MRTITRFFCDGVVNVVEVTAATATPTAAAPTTTAGDEAGGSGAALPSSLDLLPAADATPTSTPPLPGRYARLVLEGRSFMMHQIRKMVRTCFIFCLLPVWCFGARSRGLHSLSAQFPRSAPPSVAVAAECLGPHSSLLNPS